MRPPITWKGAVAAALVVGSAVADVPWFTDAEAYNAGALGNAPNQTFRSSPIVAPIFQVTTLDTKRIDPAPYLFLDWKYDGVASPMVFRADDLSLTIRGTRYLTFWEGAEMMRYGDGRCRVFDEDYELRYTVTPVGLASGAQTDLHECQVTDDGTVLISIYESVPFDLTPVGGPADGLLLDNLIQEIDPRTNELVFEWKATDHYPIKDTGTTIEESMLPTGFDYYHMNSIAKYGKNYLVGGNSFGHIILVDGTDGSTIWTLGGEDNDFEDLSGGSATGSSSHHLIRLSGDENHMTLFDNGPERVNSVGCTADCARGLHLEVDYDNMTAEVAREYPHPLGLNCLAQGGYAALENGNVLVAWGSQPGVTEHRGDKVVMDIQLGRIGNEYSPDTNAVYRAFKMDWRGTPAWDPSMAVEDGTVYVSWNGATELAGWAVFGSDHPDKIDGRGEKLAESKRRGFETAIPLRRGKTPRYLRAGATNSKGRVIGYTAVWDSKTGRAL